MTHERGPSFTEVAGIWADDVGDLEAAVEEGRERSRERRERVFDEFVHGRDHR